MRGGLLAPPSRETQQVAPGAVGAEDAGENTTIGFVGLEDDRAGPIAEENAGGAVAPVGDAGERLGPDDQCVLIDTGRDEVGGHAEAVDKAGAAG